MTKSNFFKKIVYFDEQAASDLILEDNSGDIEKISKRTKEFAGELSANAGIKTPGILKYFNFGLSGNAKGTTSDLVQTQIKTTILTSFLNFLKENEKDFFDNMCSIKITSDSSAFIRSAGMYLKMVKNPSKTDKDIAEILNMIDVSNIDKLLDQATGYYRMIGITKKDNKKFILRFNFAGIRNNYKLTDLSQMNLRIIGVEVGETNNLNISFGSDLESDDDEYQEPDIFEEDKKVNEKYKIVDVIMAGVE